MSTRRRLELIALALKCLARTAMAETRPMLDNDQMQISESTFPPGSRSEEHSHGVNEATYVLAGGQMRYALADGTVRIVELKTGDLRWRAQAETHVAENVGNTMIRLLAIRLKAAAGPSRQ